MLRIGDGHQKYQLCFDISRNTVRRYVRMYQDSGIPAEKLPSLSDARLQELFPPYRGERTQNRRIVDQGLKLLLRNMQHGFRAGA